MKAPQYSRHWIARGALWAGIVAVVAGPLPAQARSSRRKASGPPPVTGEVAYVAGDQVYLDKGLHDGLAVGTSVRLRRPGEKDLRCSVGEASEHFATCSAKGASRGQEMSFRAAPAAEAAPVAPTRRRYTSSQWRARVGKVASQGFSKVPFAGVATARGATARARVDVEHGVWAGVGGARTFQRERIDVAARAEDLFWDGFDLTGDLTAIHWTQRGKRFRFRPNSETQLYVWEASVRLREPSTAIAFEVGRVRPRYIPGLTRLDGAQLGWRPSPTTEVGVFGGVLPDVMTLEPNWERWTVGAYATTDLRPDEQVLVSATLRANYLRLVDDAQRMGTGAEVRTTVGGWLTLGSEVSLSLSTAPTVDLGLDHWSFDFDLRPIDELSFYGSARHLGGDASFGAFETLGLYNAGGTRGDLGAEWSIAEWLALSVSGGALFDPASDATRGYVSPEVRLVQLLPGRTTLAAGYIGELAVREGHTAYIQSTSLPVDGLRIWARVAYTLDATPQAAPRELTVATFGQWEPWSFLAMRLSFFTHAGLYPNGTQWGLGGSFALTGKL